jgi:creatinine amidohydrolase
MMQDAERKEKAVATKLLLEEMTRDEAREAIDAGLMVVIPTGSTEQHGPHLPLMVDTHVVTHVARAAGERAAAQVPLAVAPTMHYGVSHHHLAFAGTMSLTSHLYVESIKELVRCLHHHGVRQVVLLNGHGGNQNPNGVIAHSLVNEEGLKMSIGQASYWTIASKALVDAGANDVAPRFPGHAGGFETSLMLALRPDLVQLDRRRPPLAALTGTGDTVEHGAFTRAGGTSDDAANADGAAGKRLLEATIGAVAEYFVRFYEQTRRK